MCITPERGLKLQRRQSGLSLIELVVAIVILSIGLVALLIPITNAVRNSGDPLVAKQMAAIAEAMLEEIELQPFAVPTGSPCPTAAVCPPTQPNRQNFDHIALYDGFATTGIYQIDGVTPMGGTLTPYSLAVSAQPTPLNGVPAYLISVTVSWPSAVAPSKTLTVSAFRTNYY
jgi:MSHA pilin protein MshD